MTGMPETSWNSGEKEERTASETETQRRGWEGGARG